MLNLSGSSFISNGYGHLCVPIHRTQVKLAKVLFCPHSVWCYLFLSYVGPRQKGVHMLRVATCRKRRLQVDKSLRTNVMFGGKYIYVREQDLVGSILIKISSKYS